MKTFNCKYYINIFIKTTPKSLSILLFVSIIYTLCCVFVLKDQLKLDNPFSIIGNLLYNLSLAYIASFIFYFLTIHIKEQRDKTKINQFVGFKIQKIISLTKSIVAFSLVNLGEESTDYYPSKEELIRLFSQIKSNDKCNASYPVGSRCIKYTYLHYLFNIITSNLDLIKSIYLKIQFLDSDFIAILSKIEDNYFSANINLYLNAQWANETLEGFAESFYTYMQLVKDLEEYYIFQIKKYEHI